MSFFVKKEVPIYVWIYSDQGVERLFGNVKQITVTNEDGVTDDSTIIRFNKTGSMIESEQSSRGGYLKTRYITKYDIKGRKTETISYAKDLTKYPVDFKIDTSERLGYIYKYDIGGYIYKCISNSKRGDKYLYKYNLSGDIIECDYFINPKLLMDVTKYKYDSSRHLIGVNKFHWKRLMVKVTNEYKSFDSKGNWTQMTSYSEFLLVGVQKDIATFTRKITYY